MNSICGLVQPQEWISINSDVGCMAILLYLEKYNPDVREEHLTSVVTGDVNSKLTRLIKADLVEPNYTDRTYRLTDFGKFHIQKVKKLAEL